MGSKAGGLVSVHTEDHSSLFEKNSELLWSVMMDTCKNAPTQEGRKLAKTHKFVLLQKQLTKHANIVSFTQYLVESGVIFTVSS